MRCNGGDITSIQRSCAMQHHAFLPIGGDMIANFLDPVPKGNILALNDRGLFKFRTKFDIWSRFQKMDLIPKIA